MPQTIDVSGLPESVVNDLRQLVGTLRTRLGTGRDPSSAAVLHDTESGHIADDELARALDELRIDPAIPPLPAEFSRADIYADHD
jgi:hypothetical protein